MDQQIVQPNKMLADELFRDRVLRARRTPPEEKLLEGTRLFDQSCSLMESGIRDQFPDADDNQVRRLLEERIQRLHKLEEYGLYRSTPELND